MTIVITDNDVVLFHELIDKYGIEMQKDIAIEEMSELTKALIKNRRYGESRNVHEEIADNLICLAQLISMFNCEEEVDKWIYYKLNRIEGILKEG